MLVEEKIRSFILENYLFTDEQSALSNSDSFMETGIIDSTGILEVIYFLEEELDVIVDDEEMIPENLDSVDNIVAFVNTKKSA